MLKSRVVESGRARAWAIAEVRAAYAAAITARELMVLQREAVKRLRQELAEGGAPRLVAELEELARTWRLSPSNRVLLRAQRENVTLVLSASAWARLGRTPRKGASPLHLLAPARGLAVPYVAAAVLDVAQTEGPRLSRPGPLRGRALLVALEEAWAVLQQGRRAPVGGAREILAELVRRRLGEERAVEAELRELEVAAAVHVCRVALGAGSRPPSLRAWRNRSGAALLVSLSRVQRAARAILGASRVLEARPVT